MFLAAAGVALLHLAVALVFALSSVRGAGETERFCLPLDDAYIHLTFARNLSRTGVFGFVPGEPSGGATSPLWVFLLAAGVLAGMPAVTLSALLGGMAFVATGLLVFFLFNARLGDGGGAGLLPGLAAASAHAVCGITAWHGLSGMETALFLALGLSAIQLHARGRRWPAATAAALLLWTRPEGAALAVILAAEHLRLWLRRRDPAARRGALVSGGTAAGALLALLGFNRLIAGTWMPTTFAGRRWLYGLHRLEGAGEWWEAVRLHLASWRVFIAHNIYSSERLGGLLAFLLAGLGLLGLLSILRGGWRSFRNGAPAGPAVLTLAWCLAHNTAYILLLPIHGHACRYQALNIVLAAVLPVFGGFTAGAYFSGGGGRKPARLGAAAPAATAWLSAALLLPAGGTWLGLYAGSTKQIRVEHVRAAEWVREHTAPDAVVAAFDIGVMGFEGGRRVVDLGGLVDRRALPHLRERRAVEYMKAGGATHLVLPGGFSPSEGIDFRRRLGISAAQREGRLALEPLTRFSISRELYDLTWKTIMAASPVLRVYRIRWPAGAV